MRFASPSKVLIASVCVAAVQAAPAADNGQLVYQSPAPSGLEALTFGLSSKLSSAFSSVLSRISPPASTSDYEDQTIWEIINGNDEFKQLAHVLNYSSDATKDIFKKKNNLTFFALSTGTTTAMAATKTTRRSPTRHMDLLLFSTGATSRSRSPTTNVTTAPMPLTTVMTMTRRRSTAAKSSVT